MEKLRISLKKLCQKYICLHKMKLLKDYLNKNMYLDNNKIFLKVKNNNLI